MTPDDAARRFLEAWHAREWSAMAAAVQVRRRIQGVDGARLEQTFGTKRLQRFVLGPARTHTTAEFVVEEATGRKLWQTPDAARVGAFITYKAAGRTFRRSLGLIVTREGPDGWPVEDREASAEWGVNDVSAIRETAL